MKCCFCGPVRNCAKYLGKVLENIEQLGKLFDDYEIVIFYDESQDNSLHKLRQYKSQYPKLTLFTNNQPLLQYRTHRIAYARNYCLNYVKSHHEKYQYFVMMDFDDPNAKTVKPTVLQKYLNRNDWDGLSFNTDPNYYDIWALSIFPYCFSYNHFRYTNTNNYKIIQQYIMGRLNSLKPDELLPCISAFNGFSIYRTNKFLQTRYDGNVRTDLIPKLYLQYHATIANSTLYYPNLGHVKAYAEDCEHRAFHVQAINNSNSKIMISPEILFVN